MKSRQEVVGDACSQSTEIVPGRTLRITFEAPDVPYNLACVKVQDMTHAALSQLLDLS